MELGKTTGRLEDGDEDKLRRKLQSGDVDSLQPGRNGEFLVADLRRILHDYYPYGSATPYLEQPMTEFVLQLEQHDAEQM